MVRLKTRYLIVEANAPQHSRKAAPLQRDSIASLIKESIARSYGDYGVGMLQYAFQVIYASKDTNLIVIRCAREQCKLVETSLVFVTESQGQELRFRVVRVCGSSRVCREHMMNLTQERLKDRNLLAQDPMLLEQIGREIEAIDP
ncbi:hypothetical protein P43SY_007852 [Pythium insidiosum]|uniref:Ribonuclease P/MRP protein subunit POP5 n=1 Tax=Pythium insidiosum TaxID=114742 RepID=A0AAD5LLD2_PYTIN|nr:hypothetical protein P43SY_007852 [Pythium insidiosum]